MPIKKRSDPRKEKETEVEKAKNNFALNKISHHDTRKLNNLNLGIVDIG